MKTIQQFYNEQRHIELAGKDYSAEAKYYDPDKVQNCELDLTIAEGYNTPAYQMLANDFLMELFRSKAVDIKTVLENCSFPYARKILEAVKRNEQQLQQGSQMEGISPEMLQQLEQQIGGATTGGSAQPSQVGTTAEMPESADDSLAAE